jgi:DNA polymerase-3 subunit gamma/tau
MAKDPQTLPLLEVSDQQRERYQEQARKCETRFLYDALRLMNQCDINYRQSSNKRLLVGLTLIEVAQITQPDDAEGSGHKPRRLKSLFKQLIQQPQPKKAAPQVAAAEEAVSQSSQSFPSTPTATYNPTSRPQLKNDIGSSFKKLREKAKSSKGKMQVIPGTLSASDPNAVIKDEQLEFTQQELELQWMMMCNRMPQHLSGIATRMKNMNPVIKEMPRVEVVVENQLAFDQMMEIKGSIVNTLKVYLHNNAITLDMKVAEYQDKVHILTRREQFELMEKENPAISKLRELLDLELA